MPKPISQRVQGDSASWRKNWQNSKKKSALHRLIQEQKASIANSKEEAQEITKQIRAEFAEINTLSQKIVAGDDEDDEAVIARADAVRAEAIHATEEFLN